MTQKGITVKDLLEASGWGKEQFRTSKKGLQSLSFYKVRCLLVGLKSLRLESAAEINCFILSLFETDPV